MLRRYWAPVKGLGWQPRINQESNKGMPHHVAQVSFNPHRDVIQMFVTYRAVGRLGNEDLTFGIWHSWHFVYTEIANWSIATFGLSTLPTSPEVGSNLYQTNNFDPDITRSSGLLNKPTPPSFDLKLRLESSQDVLPSLLALHRRLH